ncbi:hypothetical protein FC756_03755 [Lysinibacillus mangiferihumi]|uniref:Uncharacterized protein n=1 Tax=Lysinibacillus mangiferihumi TaxID=1130819 RepID=A0A4U2ZE87_9BACI|nr:hypothetical protein [Lysinibacillus mangiferihumi]TKI71920.1 hypothetical protein FC756_03755 [Lysinibacillus mangiferihumi]
MEEINEKIIPENDTVKASAEAAKILANLAKEALKFGKSSEDITKADQQSTSEYNTALSDTLNAINKEISECDDPEEKSRLYKQREDVMNRMREEKEKQRQNNNEREEKDRNQATGLFAIVTAVALGAGAIATKLLLDNKKT